MIRENAMYAGSYVLSARDPDTIVAAVAANENWKIQYVYWLFDRVLKPEEAKNLPSVPMKPPCEPGCPKAIPKPISQ